MSKLKVTTISDPDNDNTALTIDSSGNVTASQGFVPSTQLSHRNLIINGDFKVWQRGTSGTTAGNTAYYTDRFAVTANHSGKFDVAQSTTAPQGFNYSKKLTVNTTKASLSTYDISGIWYKLEGYDAHKLNWGTSNAQDITLSFYVRSSVTGTYSIGIRNTGTYNKSFVSEYTISTADTWERKTINISGETSGTWATTSSGSIEILFSLGTGTGYQSSNLDSWEATSNLSSSNNVNLVATSSATFYITGVQLEVGSVATPFEHRSYGEELARCQRYTVVYNYDTFENTLVFPGMSRSGTTKFFHITLPQSMRDVTPSISLTGEVRLLNHTTSQYKDATDTLTIGGVAPSINTSGHGLTLYYSGTITDITSTQNAMYQMMFVGDTGHQLIIDGEL